jgi:hypothetical protein
MSMHGQVTDVQMFSQVLNDEVSLTNFFTSALFLTSLFLLNNYAEKLRFLPLKDSVHD